MQVQLGTLDVIIGAHLQQMGHWNLVVNFFSNIQKAKQILQDVF